MTSPAIPTPGLSLPRWLLAAALASLALRLWIAHGLPITGDEAYFYWWGRMPDWSYYDHPPMVGWWLAALLPLLGESTLALRLPAVLLPLATGGLLWWALKPLDRERAAWAVLLFWLAPLNWLNSLITTDTPLIFWSVLSVALLLRAERRALDGRAWALYALAGLCLTGAFLSKYFSAVLGLAYAAYFLLYRRDRWHAFALLLLCALPGPLLNLWWNMEHGWANIMFNVFNRNEAEAFTWKKPLLYAGMLLYLLTPAAAWLGWKHRQGLAAAARQQPRVKLLVLVPLIFFGLLTFKKVVGLHWVLAFYPFVFVLLAFGLPHAALRRCAQGLALFTALHALVVVGLSFTHLAQWEGKPRYQTLVRAFRTAELLAQVRTPDSVLMADGYSPASVYGHTLRQHVPVFGPGSFHARQDDLHVDFSAYEGRTIRVLLSDAPKLDHFTPYFDSVQPLRFVQDGVTFHAVEGRNFHYAAYRQGVQADILRRYHAVPAWLPMTGCPYCVRYCGQVRCPTP